MTGSGLCSSLTNTLLKPCPNTKSLPLVNMESHGNLVFMMLMSCWFQGCFYWFATPKAKAPPPAILKTSLSPKWLLSFLYHRHNCLDKQLFAGSESEEQLPWNAGPLQIGCIYIFTGAVMFSATDAKAACDVYFSGVFSLPGSTCSDTVASFPMESWAKAATQEA